MKKSQLVSIITTLSLLFLIAGCVNKPDKKPSFKDIFSKKTEYGIYKDKTDVLVFDRANHQLYSSVAEKSTRIISNSGVEYVEFKFKDTPLVGIVIEADIYVYDLVKSFPSSSVELEIMKVEDDKCWVWCESDSFGAILAWVE